MHFWIDKTSFNSREFTLYRNIRSKSPFPHHHRNRQSINSHNSHSIVETSHQQQSSRNSPSPPSRPYGYIIAFFHVKCAIFISVALIFFIFKLYKDGSVSKFQIVLFSIFWTVFIFCILIGYVFYGSTAPPTLPSTASSSRCPSERHPERTVQIEQIEVQDFPPAYGLATQCPSQMMPPRDDPPSYSQLFEV
jgi:hypothetical protein